MREKKIVVVRMIVVVLRVVGVEGKSVSGNRGG